MIFLILGKKTLSKNLWVPHVPSENVYIYLKFNYLKKKQFGHVLRCLLVRVHNLAWGLRSHDNTKKVVQQLPLLSFQ